MKAIMKIKKMFKKMVTTGLAVIMMTTQIPVTVFADEVSQADTGLVLDVPLAEEGSPSDQETLGGG